MKFKSLFMMIILLFSLLMISKSYGFENMNKNPSSIESSEENYYWGTIEILSDVTILIPI